MAVPHGFTTARLGITGMTCADCSAMVESTMLKLKHVSDVRVNAITGFAEIAYDAKLSTPAELAAIVETLGFQARIIQQGGDESITFCLSADQTGLVSVDQWQRAVAALLAIKGVKDCVQTSSAGKTTSSGANRLSMDSFGVIVKYDPLLVKSRHLWQTLREHGVTAVVSPTVDASDVAKEANADAWKWRLIASALLASPVVLFTILLPLCSSSMADIIDHELTPGISVGNIISLICATPIQFVVAKPLFVSAYRAARFGRTANMDTLVVLSTSTAYFYSLIVFISALAGSEIAGMYSIALACCSSLHRPCIWHRCILKNCGLCRCRFLLLRNLGHFDSAHSAWSLHGAARQGPHIFHPEQVAAAASSHGQSGA